MVRSEFSNAATLAFLQNMTLDFMALLGHVGP